MNPFKLEDLLDTLLVRVDNRYYRNKIGMILHHEFQGSEKGFEIWNEWCSKSKYYPGKESLRRTWDNFNLKPRKIGFGTLNTMVEEIEFFSEFLNFN